MAGSENLICGLAAALLVLHLYTNMAQSVSGDKKLVRSRSGLRIIASSENDRSPFELCEPPWIPDVEVSSIYGFIV